MVMPTSLVFGILLIGLAFLWSKKTTIGKVMITFGVLFYYFFSLDSASILLLSPLERPYRNESIEKAARIHTVVLLSGGEEADVLRASAVLELNEEWEKEKVSEIRVILSGTDPLRQEVDEAGFIRDYLVERGIRPSVIRLDRKSLNTRESSQNLKEMLGNRPFLLVTSAYHMTRSLDEFRYLGMQPVPLAADFKIIDPHYSIFSWLSSASNFKNCDIAFHEYGGMIFYRLIHGRSAFYSAPCDHQRE